MIRILHNIANLNYGGSQALVMAIYRQMDRSKIQFDFVTTIDKDGGFYDEAKSLGANIYVCPQYTGKNHNEFCLWWNTFFCEHKEYRIIHGHVRSTASIYLGIAKRHGLVTIAHSHSTSNGKGIAAIVKNLLQIPIRFVADWCFACSDEAGKWLFGKKITTSSRYFILKNAVNIDEYRYNIVKRNEYRAELGLGNKVTYIHVGRLHEAKNHMFLLEIFAEIHKINNNTVLLLVGDGELSGSIKKRVEQLGIINSVIMLGSRNDVSSLLQAADFFLFPSQWEGLPITVVEAQAAGLPCFISDTITKEVCISSLVKVLPIDKGTEIWTNEILKSSIVRQDVEYDIKRVGFDIESLVEWLSKFYFDIIKNSL